MTFQAVLGVQIVITMVMASTMSKIGPFVSFSRWLLTATGLIRYVHPSDEELKQIALVPIKDKKKSHHNRRNDHKNGGANVNGGETIETFNVPKQNDLQLETARVSVIDVVQLRFYSEYQWLLDFSLYSLIVYVLTEVYIGYFPARAAQEVNLSMVWCLLAVGFAYKILASLTGLYFMGAYNIKLLKTNFPTKTFISGEESGERSLVIVMGFAYLFLAMLVLILPEDTLETGLDEAYASFNASAAAFLAENTGLDSR